MAGRVVLVATPIGNLGDLAPRARQALAGADVICCEDTRRTRKLLSAAGIPAPRLIAVHAHNEAAMAGRVVARAEAGETVVVVSDAGLPGISDPGERVVRAAADAGVVVDVVPGPSAVLAALVVSGLTSGRFCFEGFLPRQGGLRRSRLAELAGERRTMVLYEAPHHLRATLEDLARVLGAGRPVALARELTKVHEEVWRGTLDDAVARVSAVPPRGEWVLVVAGAEDPEVGDAEIIAALEVHLTAGLDRRAAIAATTAELGVPRRRVYALGVALRGAGGGEKPPEEGEVNP